MNDNTRERKIRAARSALSVSGRGLILLALWEIIKTVLSFLYESEYKEIRNLLVYGSAGEKCVVIVVLLFFLGLYAFFYFYVGFHAIKEGHDQYGGRLYIVADGFLCVILFLEVALILVIWFMGEGSLMTISGVPVEFITLVAAADLFVNAIRVRKYSKKPLERNR